MKRRPTTEQPQRMKAADAVGSPEQRTERVDPIEIRPEIIRQVLERAEEYMIQHSRDKESGIKYMDAETVLCYKQVAEWAGHVSEDLTFKVAFSLFKEKVRQYLLGRIEQAKHDSRDDAASYFEFGDCATMLVQLDPEMRAGLDPEMLGRFTRVVQDSIDGQAPGTPDAINVYAHTILELHMLAPEQRAAVRMPEGAAEATLQHARQINRDYSVKELVEMLIAEKITSADGRLEWTDEVWDILNTYYTVQHHPSIDQDIDLRTLSSHLESCRDLLILGADRAILEEDGSITLVDEPQKLPTTPPLPERPQI